MRLPAFALGALVLSTWFQTGCAAKAPASTNTPLAARGVPFSLPKTVLNVELTVNKTLKTAGKFCPFSDLFFFGADAIPCEPKSATSLKAYAVTTKGVPDPTKTYLIPTSMNGGWAIDTSTSIDLSERGLLNSVEADRTNRRVDVVIGVIKGVTGIFTKGFAGAALDTTTLRHGEEKFKKEFLNSWQLVWNFDNMKKKNPGRANEYLQMWQDKNPALLMARTAYRELERLGDNLNQLLDGSIGGPSAGTLIAEVRKEIASRSVEYFLGSKETVTWSPVFEIDPLDECVNQTLITIGNCGAEIAEIKDGRLLQNPLPPAMACNKPDEEDKPNKPVTLQLSKPTRPNYGDIQACLDQDHVLKGIPFTVPVEANAKIDGSNLPEQKIQIAQWGATSCLTLPGSSYTTSISYHASTGAIRTLKFTQKSAFSKEAVDSLSGIAGDVQKSILEAREKEREAAKSKALDDLKAQRELLEERVKIKAACATLQISCEF